MNATYKLAGLTLAVTLALPAAVADATAFKYPVLIQVTANTTGDVQNPHLRSQKPEAVVFRSDGDVLGTGTEAANGELYLWNLEDWTSNGSGLEQITTTAGGTSFAAARSTDTTGTIRPEYVSFVSTGDLDPSIGNADGNQEIFIWIRTSGEVRQITDTVAPVQNDTPYSSDSGRCIVWSSNGDLDDNDGTLDIHTNPGTGFENSDGSREVFLVHLDNEAQVEAGSFTQVSSGPNGSTSGEPVIGGYYYPRQCNVLVYRSDHIQVPGGNPGNQIYIFKRRTGTSELMFAHEFKTPGNIPLAGDYFAPGISSASNFARGPHIVFHTTEDLWNNGSVAENIFRYRKFHSRLTQYTDLVEPAVARAPQVSDGGAWIGFESNGELLARARRSALDPPFNADGNFEIFRTRGNKRVRQVTNTTGCHNSQVTLQDNGVSLAFRSTCDLIPGGNNPSGLPQIFMYLQLKRHHPLLEATACQTSAGCCNEANGCLTPLTGKKIKVRKKDTLAKLGG